MPGKPIERKIDPEYMARVFKPFGPYPGWVRAGGVFPDNDNKKESA